MSEKTLVAFYGIFRKDFHGRSDAGHKGRGSSHVGKGRTVENYNSYDWYVDLGRNSQGYPVIVDVYEVTPEGLASYDVVEGTRGVDHPDNWYNRSKVDVQLDSGEVVNCWIYHQHHVKEGRPIIGGDFLEYRRK